MYIFYRLLLAHLLAEFPLQFDLIYRLKVSKKTGIWLHAFIFFAVAVLLLIPWWGVGRFWVFLVFLLLTHYALDRLKIIFYRRFQVDNLGIFLLDQVAHIGCISLVFFIELDEKLRYNLPTALNAFTVVYQDNQLILIFIGYLFATFGASFLVYYLERLLFASRTEKGFLTTAEKYYTIFGGLLITTFAWIKGYYFLLIPLVPVSQWYLFSLRKDAKETAPTIFALITNTAVATGVGFLLRLIPPSV
ncbi:MAG: DUF3307 domain-containing protein [bacterium]|nr:DUF3307 domain-containing protein [bacterium]